MKSLLIAPSLLIDCGRASKRTKGPTGAFWEPGTAPFNKLM